MDKKTEQYLLIGGGALAIYYFFLKPKTTTPVLTLPGAVPVTSQALLPASSSTLSQATSAVPAVTSLWNSIFGSGASTPAAAPVSSPVATTAANNMGLSDLGLSDLVDPNSLDLTTPCESFDGSCGTNTAFLAGMGVIY